jgi:hypothetical protein
VDFTGKALRQQRFFRHWNCGKPKKRVGQTGKTDIE